MIAAPIGIMQLTDTLEFGGLERVAVNLANGLPRARFTPHLCATRREGPLAAALRDDVRVLALRRRHRFDIGAIKRLRKYVREHHIRILHAHGTSLFVAAAAAAREPWLRIVWHVHTPTDPAHAYPVTGGSRVPRHIEWAYRVAVRRTSFVIAVNGELLEWARNALGVEPSRGCYVPNFVEPQARSAKVLQLPGRDGSRVVCVANLRPEKDIPNLLKAFKMVTAWLPEVHLLLVGGGPTLDHFESVRLAISRNGLDQHVSMLGSRSDVGDILSQCSVGVLSSSAEGLPLTLLEYGAAGLAAVATDVGQCSEVLDGGRAGLLVAARDADQLADGIARLVKSIDLRERLGGRLKARVERYYCRARAVEEVCTVYERVLSG